MEIKVIIEILFGIPAFILGMRYNMHMFQLNGYKNKEYICWLKKNLKQQWLLYFAFILGIVRLFFDNFLIDIIMFLTIIMISLVYNAKRRLYNKKKFVYTARVKRMIFSIFLLSLIILTITFTKLGIAYISSVVLILIALQLFMNVLVNILNYPIEKAINLYYINDAKNKIKNVPHLIVIGITGSYGKTSVKFYLKKLLESKYSVLATPESFNTPMGIVKTIRSSLKATDEIFICEMGARHIGDIKEICDIVHPQYGIITAIGPQHLETFSNIDNITDTKFELADSLPNDGLIFLNGDNEYINKKSEKYRNKIFYYSQNQGKGYYAKNISVSSTGTEFVVVSPHNEEERFQTKLLGIHNVINIVGAIAVANEFGICLKDLKIPVRRIQPVEHRMQIKVHGNITIIDDAYNSNPVGSKAAVETLAMFEGIRILITPGMVELGVNECEYNYKFGVYASSCCDYILLVGKKHTAPIKKGACDNGFPENKCLVYDRFEDAISYAYSIKETGNKYILLENDLPDNY